MTLLKQFTDWVTASTQTSQTFESRWRLLLSYLTVTAVILGTSGAAVYVLPTVLIDS